MLVLKLTELNPAGSKQAGIVRRDEQQSGGSQQGAAKNMYCFIEMTAEMQAFAKHDPRAG
jgi:hypothetical protein